MNAITETQVDRIRTLAAELDTLGRTALEKAAEAGRLLIDCKAQLKHGEWLPWLESNFTFTDRTARNYMKIAEARESGKLETVSDLSLSEAYQLTTDSRPEEADGRPETFGELSESRKDACRIWWDCFASEVLARHAMEIPTEEIASHTGKTLDEVNRVIRPRFIPWAIYSQDGLDVPVEVYQSCREHLVASWMWLRAEGAIYRLSADLRDGDEKTAAIRRLESMSINYKKEVKESEKYNYNSLISSGFLSKDKALGWFFFCLGEIAILDAKHAVGFREFEEISKVRGPSMPCFLLFSNAIIRPQKYEELIKELECGNEEAVA